MGWLPQAVKRDVGAPGNYSNGRMRQYLGVVLHVNAANSLDLCGWITGGGGANSMSCHFQVLKDGTIFQYIDTMYSSWCQMSGNDDYLSVETQGFPTEALTPAQVKAVALIMAYAHKQHGIPLQVADAVGQRGLGTHGMGGSAWGGHTGCPGDLRKAQRGLILATAAGQSPPLANPVTSAPVQEDDMSDAQYKALADSLAALAKAVGNQGKFTLYQCVHTDPDLLKEGLQTKGIRFLHRPGSIPVRMDSKKLETSYELLGQVVNPGKPKACEYVQMTHLADLAKKAGA